jgi:hypothetical protein
MCFTFPFNDEEDAAAERNASQAPGLDFSETVGCRTGA